MAYGKYKKRPTYRRRPYKRTRPVTTAMVKRIVNKPKEKFQHRPFGDAGQANVNIGTGSSTFRTALFASIPQAGGGGRADTFHRIGSSINVCSMYLRFTMEAPLWQTVAATTGLNSPQAQRMVANLRLVIYTPRQVDYDLPAFTIGSMLPINEAIIHVDKVFALAGWGGPATRVFEFKRKWKGNGLNVRYSRSSATSSGDITKNNMKIALVSDVNAAANEPQCTFQGVVYFHDV